LKNVVTAIKACIFTTKKQAEAAEVEPIFLLIHNGID